jgi:hypothetical protein
MQKKASVLERNLTIYLILGVVIMVLFIWFANTVLDQGEKSAARDRCQKSVEKNAIFNQLYINLPPSTINCPTELRKVDEADNIKNQKIVADALYDCRNDFRIAFAEQGRLFGSDGVFCNVCSILDVEKPVKGYQDFILNANIPDYTKELTYFEYIGSFKSKDAESVLGRLDLPVFTVPNDDVSLEKVKNEVFQGKSMDEVQKFCEEEENRDSQPVCQPGLIEQYCRNNPDDCQQAGKYIEDNELEVSQQAVIFVYARGQDHMLKLRRHLMAKSFEGKAGLAMGIAGAGAETGTFATGRVVSWAAMTASKRVGISVITRSIGLAAAPATGGGSLLVQAGVELATFAVMEYITYELSRDTPPQWGSFIVLREWEKDSASEILRDELSCDTIV